MERIVELNIEVADVHHAEGHGRRERSRPGVLVADVPARDGERTKADLHGVVHRILSAE
ncbi:hypothetical protein D3C83_106500 [compost metagenome]